MHKYGKKKNDGKKIFISDIFQYWGATIVQNGGFEFDKKIVSS